MKTHFWNTTWFRVTLGTIVSVVFLILAVQGVPLDDVGQALARVNYVWILLAIVAIIAQSWLRTVRWIELYYPEQKGLHVSRMMGITLISQLLNIVVPWRVGELARIYLAGEIEKRSKAQTLATLGVEKFFDTLMLLVLLLIIPPFMTLPNWLEGPRQSIVTLTIGLFIAAIGLIIFRERIVALLSKIYLPKMTQSLGEIVRLALVSLDVLKRWDLHLGLQILSMIIWSIGVVINYFIFLSLDLNLPLVSAVLLMAVLQVGGIVPSAPGKVGVFQALCILTLALFGVDKSIGLTYGILLYVVAYGTPIILGVLSLWWGGVNLQRLTRQAESAR